MLTAVVLLLALAPPTVPTTPAPTAVDRYEVQPDNFFLRRVSFGFGGRAFTDFYPCGLGGGLPDGCGVSPVLAATVEAGTRRFTVLAEVSTSPVPRVEYDFVVLDILRAGLGVSFGTPNVRAAVVGFGGFLSAGAEARLSVTPWASRRGHRHGIEAAAGWSLFFGELTLSYRFAPAALNRIGR